MSVLSATTFVVTVASTNPDMHTVHRFENSPGWASARNERTGSHRWHPAHANSRPFGPDRSIRTPVATGAAGSAGTAI